MKVIVYSRPDGGLSVCTPHEGARLATSIRLDGAFVESRGPVPVDSFLRGWPVSGAEATWAESEEEFIARVRSLSVPGDAHDVATIERDQLPADRTFREAWRSCPVNGVRVDMESAREVLRAQFRARRAAFLQSADVAYLRALESGDTAEAARIAAHKQALRDVTADPAIAAATTPEELKALRPAILYGEVT